MTNDVSYRLTALHVNCTSRKNINKSIRFQLYILFFSVIYPSSYSGFVVIDIYLKPVVSLIVLLQWSYKLQRKDVIFIMPPFEKRMHIVLHLLVGLLAKQCPLNIFYPLCLKSAKLSKVDVPRE